MRAAAKLGLVGGGYAGALAIAGAVVWLYVALTSHVDRVAQSGMTAFGDGLVFLAAFGVLAVAPTAAALYFLRPYPAFWRALSTAAVTLAASAVVSAAAYVAMRAQIDIPVLVGLADAGILRLFFAVVFVPAFLAAAVFAPSRGARIALGVSAAFETISVATFVLALVADART
jgi:hypothetical protein